MFRRWALQWLRDALQVYDPLLKQDDPAAKQQAQQRLSYWQRDPDLAGLRDEDAVAKLPQTEGDACRKFWADVERYKEALLPPSARRK